MDRVGMFLRRRANAGYLCVLALLLLGSCQSSGSKSAPSKSGANTPGPLNLVLVTIDTQRADRLGCYGYSKIKTPVKSVNSRVDGGNASGWLNKLIGGWQIAGIGSLNSTYVALV
jgi:hypothetical protein